MPHPNASLRRQLLALYVDYLVFTAVYEPIAWLARSALPLHWGVTVAVFAALECLLWILRINSPGRWALGIDAGPAATADPRIKDRERWWTMVAGVLLVLEGSKNLVRWTEGMPVPPFLGGAAPDWIVVGTIVVLGAANVVAGLLILRTRLAGAGIGAGVIAFELAAVALQRDAFAEWAGRAVVARRAIQGLPVRSGEVEFMQALATTALPLALLVGLVWLAAIVARFRTRTADD